MHIMRNVQSEHNLHRRRILPMTKASQRMMFSAEEKMRTLQNYKNGVFKRQVEELQLK